MVLKRIVFEVVARISLDSDENTNDSWSTI